MLFTACTIMCGKAVGITSIMRIPRGFTYVTVASWLCTFWGTGRFLAHSLAARTETPGA